MIMGSEFSNKIMREMHDKFNSEEQAQNQENLYSLMEQLKEVTHVVQEKS